ncbi:MAG: hypothetical protein RLZ98_1546 [Pseudomonadota bacterium]|jgi:hypothetical protein
MYRLVGRKFRLAEASSADRMAIPGVVAGTIAMLALAQAMVAPAPPAMLAQESNDRDSGRLARGTAGEPGEYTLMRRQWQVGGYSGISHTHQSTVHIKNGDDTDMTVSGFNWIGRPFKAPIYYGLRGITWSPMSRFGGMLDFTHAKAIANAGDTAKFTGKRNGKPLASEAKIGDTFRHLEFSHGHNMVTLNGLLSLMPHGARIRPYIGAGGGIALPHTEVGFKGDNARTYEYQFAGYVGQGLAGVEVPLGRISLFVEYKFSYAPYHVPLSHEPYGWLLVTDLWRQFSAWWRGEAPPGGTLKTTLASHHGVGGVLLRVR